MRFSYKIQKVLRGDAYTSARRHMKQWFMGRAPLRFDAAKITATIDRQKFQEIYGRYAMADPGDEWPKYLEIERWMEINLKRVRDLGLDLGGRKRVLDIGSGTGYFLYICQYLGHDVLGMDIDDERGFAEMIELLGVKRVIWRIEAYQPLPDLGAKFDVVTAHMICFNGHKSDKLWKIAEWEFFLDDLMEHRLVPGGQVCLELNREYDDSLYTPELKAYFEARGAEIHTQRVHFNPLLPAPVGVASAAR
ncbi:MAG TPA: class I SAM-dependent methyltransferase [Chthoniobacterales bacterium]|jgi:SAM-dependent methyltransferase|nr:class I SAM-dependent methyltransferase [Chthoniobacterales bacterium]